jgi:TonB family protein
MDFLSLQGSAEPPTARRLTRAEAIGLSVLAHGLLLLLLIQGPRLAPEGLKRWLRARPVPAGSVPEVAGAPLDARTPPEPPPPAPPQTRIPLKFAYVKVPNDTATAPNRDATLLSDRDRRARQEVPTPPDATLFTRDPHSKGDSIDRVRPDPTRPEGPDAPTPSGPEVTEHRADDRIGLGEEPGPGQEQGNDNPPADAVGPEGSSGDATIVRGDLVPPAGGAGPNPTPAAGEGAGRRGNPPTGGQSTGPAAGSGARRPADVKPQTEYKFQFNNPGWLRGGGYGTMSFDTQGFPWGEYARLLYVAIRNAWLERIPLAAREGIAGYTCQHFIIAREGSITALEIVRPSVVPPFTKAASDAIRAASPLPPLPDEFPKSEEGVTFCFYYNMYPGEAD